MLQLSCLSIAFFSRKTFVRRLTSNSIRLGKTAMPSTPEILNASSVRGRSPILASLFSNYPSCRLKRRSCDNRTTFTQFRELRPRPSSPTLRTGRSIHCRNLDDHDRRDGHDDQPERSKTDTGLMRFEANGGTARVVACRRAGRPDPAGFVVAQRSHILRRKWPEQSCRRLDLSG